MKVCFLRRMLCVRFHEIFAEMSSVMHACACRLQRSRVMHDGLNCYCREAGVADVLPWPTQPADEPDSFESNPGPSWEWPAGNGDQPSMSSAACAAFNNDYFTNCFEMPHPDVSKCIMSDST